MNRPDRTVTAMASYYGFTAVYQNYISKFLTAQGLTDGQVGILMAAPPLISLIAQPVWGTIGDRARSKNNVLRLMYILGAIAMLSYLISGAFLYLLPMVCLYSFFFTAIQPMNDAIVLEALEPGHSFGPVRMAGTIAFAIISPLAGTVIGTNWGIVPYLAAGLMLAAMCCSYAVPTIPGHQSEQGHKKMSFADVFRQRELMGLLLFVTPLQITMGYFYTYFQLHFLELEGANSTLLGLCYTISSAAEVPFLLFSDRIYKKLGAGRLLITSGLAITARWLLVGTLTNVYAVMATQLFHGWGFIVMTVSLAYYVNDHVPAELKASGQMLLGMVGFGIARAIGNLGGAVLLNFMSKQQAFYVSAAVSALAVICFFKKYWLGAKRT